MALKTYQMTFFSRNYNFLLPILLRLFRLHHPYYLSNNYSLPECFHFTALKLIATLLHLCLQPPERMQTCF